MNANIEMKLLLESFHIPAYLHGVICYWKISIIRFNRFVCKAYSIL